MTTGGEGQNNPQGQPQGEPQGQPQGQPQGEPQGLNNEDKNLFRYSDETPMSEFFKDYPQYADNPNFNKYKTIKAFAEGHDALLSKLGTSVSIPNNESTPEQWNEFYSKLGRPESADKYEFEDKLPEGLEIDEKLDGDYRNLAYEIGLTSTQAQKLREFYNSAVEAAYLGNKKEVETRLADEHSKNVAAIKDMWGADYKAKTKIAMNVARQVLSQDTLDYLDATGLGNNAKFIKDFYELSKRLSGDNRIIDGQPNYNKPQTLESMESEAMKILRTSGWQNDPVLKNRYEELTQLRGDLKYGQE